MATKNVFTELGFDTEGATIEAWRGDLARIIRECFRRSQVSQDTFARRLRTKQSVISRIVNGRIKNYSVEYLLRLCIRLGTRGVGTWGPSADEACVTIEVTEMTGTATFSPMVTMNTAEFVLVPIEIRNTKKAVPPLNSSIAKLN